MMNEIPHHGAPDAAPDAAVQVIRPTGLRSRFVFASPHSGSAYPEAFLDRSALSLAELRRSEDAHVDALMADAPALGAPLVRALFPRSFIDPNRAETELDPVLFGPQAHAIAGRISQRAAAGLGIVPRLAGEGCAIYDGPLEMAEAEARIRLYYRPYHAALAAELEAARASFGSSVLIDCHSMPSASARRADIVLGDRFGASCAPEITDCAERLFRAEGFRVVRNRPYAGGFSTEHYGCPAEGRHALQIEINRALYMHERSLARTVGFDRLREKIARVTAGLIATDTGLARAAE